MSRQAHSTASLIEHRIGYGIVLEVAVRDGELENAIAFSRFRRRSSEFWDK
jgi:hypothetical protein